MVAEIVVDPEFVAVKEGILPEPLAAIPIAGLLFVQLKIVPATGLENAVPGIVAPLHTKIFEGTVTVVVGFTVIVS